MYRILCCFLNAFLFTTSKKIVTKTFWLAVIGQKNTSSKAKQSPPQAKKSRGSSASSQPQVVGLALVLGLGLGLSLGNRGRPSWAAGTSGCG